MTNRERVIQSLSHKRPDRIPYHIAFTKEARRKTAEYLGDPLFEEKLDNAFTIVSLRRKVGYKKIGPELWTDEFGVHYDQTVDKDIGAVVNRRVNPENVDTFEFPDPDNPERYAELEGLVKSRPDRFFIINHGFSLFERAWSLAGMEEILTAMIGDPDFAETLLDRILSYNLRIIRNFCGFGIDAMMFGDDWGQQQGLIMGPALWRRFIKPRIKEMYSEVKKQGKKVFIHSCGKIDEIIPDLVEAGVDVINPFQPEVTDLLKLKQQYGMRVSFYGGISTQKTLPFGTEEEVEAEVRKLLAEIGRDGGLIAAPAHAIPADARPANIIRMIKVLDDQ